MNQVVVGRPKPDEYTPFHARYVERVPGEDILSTLQEQLDEVLGFIGFLDPVTADYRYAPGKWSVKEVVGHVIDTERIFAFRALSFARGETQPLPGFEEDDYVCRGEFSKRTLQSLACEFEHVRRANLALFASFHDSEWESAGSANGCELSVRAIAWILAGHAAHHLAVIRERYLGTG